MNNLESITKKLIEFRSSRYWEKFHTPENLAKAISVESSELLELFLWEPENVLSNLDKVKEEVADIFIFLTYFCKSVNIDLLESVEEKIRINEKKYPVKKCYGKSLKYDRI